MYDVIVVGARCAGSPLAMLMARRGARVLLLDRATFPSDIPHGHFIHRHGPARLQRWSLLEPIARATCPIDSMVYDAGDFPLVVHDLVEAGVAWGYGPRRATLDKLLVDAAVESGAELREAFAVDDYLRDGNQVVGVAGRDPGGRRIEERATIVVGADGRNSRLAKTVGAPLYNNTPALACYFFSYWSGAETEDFELYYRPVQRRVIFAFRTEHDLFGVFVGFPAAEMPAVRQDIEGAFRRAIALIPDLEARLRSGRRAERFYGASDLPNFYRKPYGPGWALVGDAGLHKDPFLALGICDALRDVELLAEAIGDGLDGRRPMIDALASFEQSRNDASAHDYADNIAMARFSPLPPEVFAVRASLRDDPARATRFMKARFGMIDPSTLDYGGAIS